MHKERLPCPAVAAAPNAMTRRSRVVAGGESPVEHHSVGIPRNPSHKGCRAESIATESEYVLRRGVHGAKIIQDTGIGCVEDSYATVYIQYGIIHGVGKGLQRGAMHRRQARGLSWHPAYRVAIHSGNHMPTLRKKQQRQNKLHSQKYMFVPYQICQSLFLSETFIYVKKRKKLYIAVGYRPLEIIRRTMSRWRTKMFVTVSFEISKQMAIRRLLLP